MPHSPCYHITTADVHATPHRPAPDHGRPRQPGHAPAHLFPALPAHHSAAVGILCTDSTDETDSHGSFPILFLSV